MWMGDGEIAEVIALKRVNKDEIQCSLAKDTGERATTVIREAQ